MILKFYPPIYWLFLISGPLLTISSNTIFSAWLGLEMNLLAFIPLIIGLSKDKTKVEAAVKYFLVQALASSMILFIALTMNLGQVFSHSMMPMSILTLTLLLKVGAAPFHFWFPKVASGLSWSNSFILMTWQKLAPLVILSYSTSSIILYTFAIVSVIVGSISPLTQTSLRKIFAFSSIMNLGWMLIIMTVSNVIWIPFYVFYVYMLFLVLYPFSFMGISHINDISEIRDPIIKFLLPLNILSLAGLPPLLGFFPKWLGMMMLMDDMAVLMLFIGASGFGIYFYLRMCVNSLSHLSYINNWFKMKFSIMNFSYLILTMPSIAFSLAMVMYIF